MSRASDIASQFERDGVAPLGCVLNDQQLDDLRHRLDRLCVTQDGRAMPGVRDLADHLDGRSDRSVMQRVNLYRIDDQFDALVRRADILGVVSCILGPNVQLFRDQCFYKPGRCGGEVYMHQDNRYWHLDPPLAAVVFIALDECTLQTGCVHYIPGSHRWGQVEHVRAADGRSILLEAVADKAVSLPMELPAGHASVHHCQILHWSPENQSPRPRRAHTIEYVAAGVRCRGKALTDAPLVSGSLSAQELASAEAALMQT
jgi:2-oxoglutarate-dependent dioxygenase